jgi:hypothetical protein
MSATNSAGVPARMRAALAGRPLPPSEPDGRIVVIRHADALGCPLVLAIDQRDPGSPTISGFAVLDDAAATIAADPEEHRQRWRSWLRWGDLLQFLSNDGLSDGGQFASSELDIVDPSTLAVSGGTGAYLALRAEERADQEHETSEGVAAEPASVPVDPKWREVLDLIDPDAPTLASLARHLADRGLPVPIVGYELGSAAWQAEMAWPGPRVAVVTHLSAGEQQERDAAYAKAGWHIRLADDWRVDDLANLLTAGAGGGQPGPAASGR